MISWINNPCEEFLELITVQIPTVKNNFNNNICENSKIQLFSL